MILERRAFLESLAKEEEQLVFLQARKELLQRILKNKYSLRDGIDRDRQVARQRALPSWERTARGALFSLAGRKDERKAKSGIRHNFAADVQAKLIDDIPRIEEEVRDLIRLHSSSKKAFSASREQKEQTQDELLHYVATHRDDPKQALKDYRESDRAYRLLSAAAESGRTYYTYLRALRKQLLGAAATAKRPLGRRPYFDILLQRAYTRQSEDWSASAETLQLDFLTDLHTLKKMTTRSYPTAGQIAFSPYFFDTTMTRLLTMRRGDELHALLETAANQLAALLLALETDRRQAKEDRDRCAEGAGLAL